MKSIHRTLLKSVHNQDIWTLAKYFDHIHNHVRKTWIFQNAMVACKLKKITEQLQSEIIKVLLRIKRQKNVIVIKHPWRSLFMTKLWPKSLQVNSWIVFKFAFRITIFLNNCGWLPLIYIKLKNPFTSLKSLVVVPHNVAVFSIKTTFPLNWLMHIFVPSNALAVKV